MSPGPSRIPPRPQAPIGAALCQLVHVLALASAVFTAGATILIRLGFRGADAFTSYWINLVVGTVGLWLAVLVAAPSGPSTFHGILYFVLAGLVGTTAGRLLRFVSIERVGASVAAALTNLHPFISAGLAIVLLGEAVTVPIIAGTAVIVTGTALLSAGGGPSASAPPAVYPFLSAACFGAVAILRKLGLGAPAPFSASPPTSPPRWSPSPSSSLPLDICAASGASRGASAT